MKETGPEAEGVWHEFSQMWFTLMPSTRPFTFRDYTDLAEHVNVIFSKSFTALYTKVFLTCCLKIIKAASAYETIRDINFASRIIEDMSGSTLDDPLFECYKKLRCSVSPLEKESDDYKMIVNYLEKTYEPVQVGDMVTSIYVHFQFSFEILNRRCDL